MTLISSLQEKLSFFQTLLVFFVQLIVISLSFLNEMCHRLLRSLSEIIASVDNCFLNCTLFLFKKILLVFSLLLQFVLLITYL